MKTNTHLDQEVNSTSLQQALGRLASSMGLAPERVPDISAGESRRAEASPGSPSTPDRPSSGEAAGQKPQSLSIGSSCDKLLHKIKSRVRKRDPQKVAHIRNLAAKPTLPPEYDAEFHTYERAFLNAMLYVCSLNGWKYDGYIGFLARKHGMCEKTGYRAIEKAEALGICKFKPGKYNRWLRRSEPGRITVVCRKCIRWLSRVVRTGLWSPRSNLRDQFFVRPGPQDTTGDIHHGATLCPDTG